MSKSEIDEHFREASAAAFETCVLLSNAKRFAGMNRYDAAKKCLSKIPEFIRYHLGVLELHEERLALAADRPFRDGEQYSSSGHIAVVSIWSSLDLIVQGDENDVKRFFDRWNMNLSKLKTAIIREQSKLFTGQQSEPLQAEVPSIQPAKKLGRKGRPEQDLKIADEYSAGLNVGKWDSQADYRRQKHPDKADPWFSKLLKRVRERKIVN